jgi:hypothetical protein
VTVPSKVRSIRVAEDEATPASPDVVVAEPADEAVPLAVARYAAVTTDRCLQFKRPAAASIASQHLEHLAAQRPGRQDQRMGSGANRSTKDYLYSLDQTPASKSVSLREQNSLPLQADESARDNPPTYQLPKNLPSPLSHLADDQLERLLMSLSDVAR